MSRQAGGWQDTLSVALRSARPPFLLLTPSMLALAAALVWHEQQQLPAGLLLVVVLVALSAAAASNLLNEFFDAHDVDQWTQPTPFSGGSKALVEQPAQRERIKWLGLLLVSVSVWGGLYLVAQTGWPLLLLGVLGVALVIGYSPVLNRFPVLCLLAPGLGYGLVMFVGASWALRGAVGGDAWLLLPVPLLQVSALLLLNQFPDVQADRQAGRRHALTVWGSERSWSVFAGLHLLAMGWLGVMLLAGLLPAGAGGGLLLLPLLVAVLWLSRSMAHGAVVLLAMGGNVALVLLTPLFMAVGMWLSA